MFEGWKGVPCFMICLLQLLASDWWVCPVTSGFTWLRPLHHKDIGRKLCKRGELARLCLFFNRWKSDGVCLCEFERMFLSTCVFLCSSLYGTFLSQSTRRDNKCVTLGMCWASKFIWVMSPVSELKIHQMKTVSNGLTLLVFNSFSLAYWKKRNNGSWKMK